MKELFEMLEGQVVTHLWDIAREVDANGGFGCRSQVEDVRDCLSALKKMREILAIPGVR